MILDGAIFPILLPNGFIKIVTAQISTEAESKVKRLSISKWHTEHFRRPTGLERKIQECLTSQQQRQHLLLEQDSNLRSLDRSSCYGKIIWIDSQTIESINQSFLEVARQLGIVSSADMGDEEDPKSWTCKVYHYLDKEYPPYVKGAAKPTLIMFHCSRPQTRSPDVALSVVDYLPPSDLPNKSHSSVLITLERAKYMTRRTAVSGDGRIHLRIQSD